MRLTDDMLAGIDNVTVFDGLIKARAVLLHHKKVSVSISGGSDSDIVLDIIEKCRNDENEISYIWFDTGVEYRATKEHLSDSYEYTRKYREFYDIMQDTQKHQISGQMTIYDYEEGAE